MSKNTKRRVAKTSKKLDDDNDLKLQFDENFITRGATASPYATWLGGELRTRISYHLVVTKEVPKEEWEKLWSEIKAHWKIENDKPKKVMLKKAKKNCTNFRSYLTRNYVYKGLNPFKKFPFLDESKWQEFKESRLTEAFKKIHEKTSKSAKAQKNHSKTGRGGLSRLRDNIGHLWPLLVSINPHLEVLQDYRSKLFVAARAGKDKDTGLYEVDKINDLVDDLGRTEKRMKEDGTYYERRSDPITECFGQEHGGRTRLYSCVIGATQIVGGLFKGEWVEGVNLNRESQSDSSCASYSDHAVIQDLRACELFMHFDVSTQIVIAEGRVHPTPADSIVHDNIINEGCLIVQVDTIMPQYAGFPVPNQTCTSEISLMSHTLGKCVQWPINALKIKNSDSPHQSASGSRNSPIHSASRHNDDVSPYIPSSPQDDQYRKFDYSYDPTIDNDEFVDTLWANSEDDRVQPLPKKVKVEHPQLKKTAKTDEERQAKEIDKSLKVIKNRCERIRKMVDRLHRYAGREYDPFHVSTPDGMFSNKTSSWIEYEAILKVFAKGWLDITIVSWFETYFYEESISLGKPCGFLNANSITARLCQLEPEDVKTHIIEISSLHKDKEYLLAPYLTENHWILFIISPKSKKVFIVDSLKGVKDQEKYLLTKIIREAFGGNIYMENG